MEEKIELNFEPTDKRCKEFVGVYENKIFNKPGRYYCKNKNICKNYNLGICFVDVDKKKEIK